MTHMDDNAPLPPMSEAILTAQEVDVLFSDIAAHTEIQEILIKSGPGRVNDNLNPTLDDAQNLLNTATIRGVQIRYRHNNTHWWDTLMHTPSGIRLVRIRHDFDTRQTTSS